MSLRDGMTCVRILEKGLLANQITYLIYGATLAVVQFLPQELNKEYVVPWSLTTGTRVYACEIQVVSLEYCQAICKCT